MDQPAVHRLITAARVLTGPRGVWFDDGAVLVAGDRIAAVGPRAQVAAAVPGSVEVLEYPESTVLPGLINAHVHLAFDAGPDPVESLRTAADPDVLCGMAMRARQLLGGGVTTARDLGDRGGFVVRLRDAIASGRIAGPRIVTATAPLTVPGGHCWFLGGEVDGASAIRERVRRNVAAGADVIKVMVSGGQMTPTGAAMWQSQFDTDEVRVIVDEARTLGVPVAAHAHGVDAIESAAAAGVDTVEHCSFLAEGFTYAPREDVAAELARRGIAVCATHGRSWRAFTERLGWDRAHQLFGRVSWLHQAGVQLIAGTDAGLPGVRFEGFAEDLEFFAHLGFDNETIIEFATIAPARALRLGDTTGRLAPGYAADVLVVHGDPLTNLASLADIELVLADGRASAPTADDETAVPGTRLPGGPPAD